MDSLVEQKRRIPCEWMAKKDSTRCLKDFADNDKYRRHILQHSWNQLYCNFGNSSKSRSLKLETQEQWLLHWTQSMAFCSKSPTACYSTMHSATGTSGQQPSRRSKGDTATPAIWMRPSLQSIYTNTITSGAVTKDSCF